MNRAQRIRKAAPGAPDEVIERLAALPLPVVNDILVALRDARKDAVAQYKELRRQRRREARKYHWYDEDQLAARNARIVKRNAERATANLDALTSLASLADHAQEMIALAVDGLRANGYSDTEIGVAIGYPRRGARQAVGQHYGRRGASEREPSGS